MNIRPEVSKAAEKIIPTLGMRFSQIDAVAEENTRRILEAFQAERVSEAYFAGTTGYGYGDVGRDALERIFARVFGAQSALVRMDFVNGTHALTAALFGCLAPGEKLLCVTGEPYDTMQTVIGLTGNMPGSLKYYGIGYEQTEIGEDFTRNILDSAVRVLYLQRSCGYSQRASLSVDNIEEIIHTAKAVRPDIIALVDNCYGEFTDMREPTAVGADLCAGSLIKNPGGGLAPRGGYICGRADLVERAAYRLTSPGIGGECGASLGQNRLMYQGLFVAPHTTAQALKTAAFCAAMLREFGFEVSPGPLDVRSDTVQTVTLRSAERLVRFCRGVQAASPVDAFASPEPWKMPGYDCKVVMAAGTFIAGSTSELSCDGPLREPYNAYMQGGLTFEAGKLGVMSAISEMLAE
jgi:cystathionine beta-lyase family protein involved in aluminum resistance